MASSGVAAPASQSSVIRLSWKVPAVRFCKQRLSLRAIARNLGMAKNAAKKYAEANTLHTKKLIAKDHAKAEALAASLMFAD